MLLNVLLAHDNGQKPLLPNAYIPNINMILTIIKIIAKKNTTTEAIVAKIKPNSCWLRMIISEIIALTRAANIK